MGSLQYRTSNGWQTSEAGVNVLNELPATGEAIYGFSLFVEEDTFVILNGSEHEVFVTNKLGMNYMSANFVPVEKLAFKTSGVKYFIAYSCAGLGV